MAWHGMAVSCDNARRSSETGEIARRALSYIIYIYDCLYGSAVSGLSPANVLVSYVLLSVCPNAISLPRSGLHGIQSAAKKIMPPPRLCAISRLSYMYIPKIPRSSGTAVRRPANRTPNYLSSRTFTSPAPWPFKSTQCQCVALTVSHCSKGVTHQSDSRVMVHDVGNTSAPAFSETLGALL